MELIIKGLQNHLIYPFTLAIFYLKIELMNFTAPVIAIIISLLSLFVSVATYIHVRHQFSIDYSTSVIANLENENIKILRPQDRKLFELKISNTSKQNAALYLRITSDGIDITSDEKTVPIVYPYIFQSSIITLSRADAGANSKTFSLLARQASVRSGYISTHGQDFLDTTSYWVKFELVNAENGRVMYTIHCSYVLEKEVLKLAAAPSQHGISDENASKACVHIQQ